MGRTMPVIRYRLNVRIDMRTDMPATLTMINPSGNDVPQMRDHTSRNKSLSVIIKIDSPRITKPVGNHLETVFYWVVTPDSSIDIGWIFRLEFCGERFPMLIDSPSAFWLTHHRGCGEALATVKPSIGPPDKAIKNFMTIANTPTTQTDLDIIYIRLVVAISIRKEK